MRLGLDAYQALTPFAQRIANAGIRDVGRYTKNLSATEIQALHAAGISIWLIFEAGARNVLGGGAQGQVDGILALNQCRGLNVPEGTAVYATADMDVAPSQVALASEYWNAFVEALNPHYEVGAYANGTVLQDLGLAYAWLLGASAWNGSKAFLASGKAAMVQGPTLSHGGLWAPLGTAPINWPDLGFSYDPDVIFADDIGAWKPATQPQPTQAAVFSVHVVAPDVGKWTIEGDNIRQMQTALGVTADGIVGPITLAALTKKVVG